MAKRLLLTFFLFSPFILDAQTVPQGISYQAIARDSTGEELPNQSIGVEFRLLDGPGGNLLYHEQHSIVTNDFGLFNVVIGSGTVVSGNFSQVNWSGGNVHLAVWVDGNGGSNYTFLGESRFQSVPYALSSGGEVWTSTGSGIHPVTLTDSVGIGITAPQHPLDVSGDINTGSGYKVSGGAPGGQYLRGDGTRFVPAVIDSADLPVSVKLWGRNGSWLYPQNLNLNVGIGTNTPVTPLDVNGLINSSTGYVVGGTSSPAGLYLRSDGSKFTASPIMAADLPASLVPWLKTGNKLHPTVVNDSVGIGTINPLHPLDVTGRVNSSAGYLHNNTAVSGTYLRGNGTAYVSSVIQLTDLPTGLITWTRTGNKLFPATLTDSIGVGTANPLHPLHVSGRVNSTAGYLHNNTAASGTYLRGNGTAYVSSSIQMTDLPAGALTWSRSGNKLYPSSITDSIGVGTATPQFALDVSGSINTNSGYKISGSATQGNYLRGNGGEFVSSSIQAADLPAGVFLWTRNGGRLSPSTVTDSVGIGTSSPLYQLQVNNNALTTSGVTASLVAGSTGSAMLAMGTSANTLSGGIRYQNNNSSMYLRTAGTDRLVINNSGNVGIQVANPLYALDVGGAINSGGLVISGTAPAGSFLRGNGSAFVPATLDTSDLPFSTKLWSFTSGNVHLTNAANRVGIGTNSPDEELVVGTPLSSGWAIPAVTVGSSTSGGAVEIGSYNGTTRNTISIEHGPTWGHALIRSSGAAGFQQGDIVFANRYTGLGTSTPMNKLDVAGSMVVGSFAGSASAPVNGLAVSGNVGIGTSTPGTILDVSPSSSGYIRMNRPNSSTPAGFALATAGSWKWFLFSPAGGEDLAVYNGASSDYVMHFESTNNYIGINTVTPATQLHLAYPSGTSNGFSMQNTIDSDIWHQYVYSSNDLALFFNGIYKGAFDDITGAYTNISDRRMKKNILPYQGALEKIRSLKVVSYNFNPEPSGSAPHVGFIAQDVKEILPNLVHYNEESDMHTMDYSGFGVLAVGAIQELEKKYEARIASLEQALEHMQRELDQLKNQD